MPESTIRHFLPLIPLLIIAIIIVYLGS